MNLNQIHKRMVVFLPRDLTNVLKSFGLFSGTSENYVQNPKHKPSTWKMRAFLLVSYVVVIRYFILTIPKLRENIFGMAGQLTLPDNQITVSAFIWSLYSAMLVHMFLWGLRKRKLDWLQLFQVGLYD